MRNKKKFVPELNFWSAMTLISIIALTIFVIYPMLSMLVNAFHDPETGKISLTNFNTFFQKEYYYSSLINSIKVTLLVTVFAVILGTMLAYVMASVKIAGKGFIDIIIILSMLSPPFIGAYAWVQLLGRQGIITKMLKLIGINIGSIYGFKGILLAFTVKLFPYVYLYVSGALKKMDVSLLEAAEGLGCSGAKKVFTIVMPLILPTVAAAALVVFTNAFADFGTPMLIGEGYRTMPSLVYNEYVGEVGGSSHLAAALCVIMIFIAVLVFAGQKYIVNRKSYIMSSLKPMEAKKVKGLKNFAAHLFVYLLVAIAFLPQFTVIATSFRNSNGLLFTEGYGFGNYKMAFSRAGNAITNTYKYSLIALVIILFFGMIISYVTVRRKSPVTNVLDSMAMFPFIIPGAVIGISLLSAFNKKPLLLSGTAAIIIVSFVIRRMPYTVRAGAAILYQLSPSMEEASISLGYSPFKTFKNVTAKLMMSGIISGAILSWITCINELSSSIIMYVGATKTISVSIYLEALKGYPSVAATLAAMLTYSTVIALLIVFKISGSKEITL